MNLSSRFALTFTLLLAPVIAQAQGLEDVCVPAPHFLFMRAASNSAVFLGASREFCNSDGPNPLLTVGAIIDPHGEYKEIYAGPGFTMTHGASGAVVAIPVAYAVDGLYLEPFIYAWASKGPLNAYVFGAAYVPLQERATWQVLMDPLVVQLKKAPIAIGGSYSYFKFGEFPAEQKAGPHTEYYFSMGSVLLEYMFPLENVPENDVRATLKLFL